MDGLCESVAPLTSSKLTMESKTNEQRTTSSTQFVDHCSPSVLIPDFSTVRKIDFNGAQQLSGRAFAFTCEEKPMCVHTRASVRGTLT